MSTDATYDRTPLTVAGLRAVLAELPDDMPVWGAYDSGFGGGALSVGDCSVAEPGEPIFRGRTDRPVLILDI